MKRSSIDIGSNSVLLLIAELDSNKLIEIEDHSSVTALGKNLDQENKFIQESMDDTFQALVNYKKIIESHGLSSEDTIVTATEASRVAKNSKEFFRKIKMELGFNIQTISSDGEAYYTGLGISLGVIQSSTDENIKDKMIIIDLGGASTEVIEISLNPFSIIDSISMPMGSVRGQDWLIEDKIENQVSAVLKNNNLKKFHTKKGIFVAGTATTLACMIKNLKAFDAAKINCQVLKRDEFKIFVSSILEKTSDELLHSFPYIGTRAKTVGAGGMILSRLIDELEMTEVQISTMGLRHGTLFEGVINERFNITK